MEVVFAPMAPAQALKSYARRRLELGQFLWCKWDVVAHDATKRHGVGAYGLLALELSAVCG
jgi:hypothetical protein